MTSGFHLAQVNIGRLRAPIDAPETRDFVNSLERINALAESSPGFVWRLVGKGGDATDIRAFDDPDMAINLSVWESLEALAAFVYRSAHRDIMRRRREWFHEMAVYQALWWIPAGHRPDPAEARDRLETLHRSGPTARAFTFRTPFPPRDQPATLSPILESCA
jgi:heme-degrading monooxygenase HmoA